MFESGSVVFDVTAPFSPHVPCWPTHPAPVVEPLGRVAQGAGSNVSLPKITSYAGTHVDANWHVIDSGPKLQEIPLERCNGHCYVARCPDDTARIDVADLEAANVPPGTERLILRTRNSRVWNGWTGDSPIHFRDDYVGMSPDAARWLVDRGVRLVGIDALSIGPFGPQNRDSHTTLLGNDALVIELLDLSNIEPGPCDLVCLPLKPTIGDGAPARVLLVRRS